MWPRRVLSIAALAGFCAGCPATGDEVRPPEDQFYFPTGMDVSPDQETLFVASANSDLRYDSGSVQVVDLRTVDNIIEDWLGSGEAPEDLDCAVDLLVPYTLVCDENEVIRRSSSVRIGNFATDLKVQALDDPDLLRLFVAVRGDPSLTWIDYDVQAHQLRCSSSSGYAECDDEHRLIQLRNDEDFVSLPPEPFGVYVDSTLGYVVMTHLQNGAITLADAPPDGEAPIVSDAIGNLFAGDPQTGFRAAVGVAGRAPGTPNDRIYVTSSLEARVQTLIAVRPQGGGLPTLVPAEFFFMSRGVTTSNIGRGIAFASDGSRAYIVNRAPPMLHIIDTSLDALGVPRNAFVGAVELCPEAANLTVTTIQDRERIFVSCFRNGQVWSIDPRGAVVDSIIEVGRGPHALVAAPGRNRLYVSNNLEGTVAVVDLTPGAETENRVVLRLGRPQSAGEAP